MSWFLIALIAPALWSISNHIDKFLVGRYFKGAAGALIIFSALIGILVVPIIYLIHPDVFSVTATQAGIMLTCGLIDIIAVALYLHALQKGEASVVVPFFQLVPVLTFLLAYLILHETLTNQQIMGMSIVVLSGMALALDLQAKIPKLHGKLVLLMLGSSGLLATSALLFKVVAVETDFWTTAFWNYLGTIIMGVIFFSCVPKYRREFFQVFQHKSGRVIGLNLFNEIINVLASLAMRFASLLAPLALVYTTVNGLQPVFVLLGGIGLTLWWPRFGEENLQWKPLLQKLLTVGVMVIGTYLLNS